MADFKIWMNGRLVLQAEAVLPVNSAAVFYATNVFEGLRAYWNERDGELYGFRLADHFARLRESMKMMRFSVPYSDDELFEAVRAVLAGNEVQEDVHMHLVAYVGGAGLDATSPTGLYINPRRRQRVTEGKGVSACVSSWARTSDNAIPIRLKCGANYQNGRLAKLQAKVDGYDEPIFLNGRGEVAEGTGATVFMVRKGRAVKFDVCLINNQPVPAVVRQVKLAESLGFDTAWITDSHLVCRELWVPLPACVLGTSRIRAGPGVTVPHTRHFSVTASAIATLHDLAGDRLVLGIGTGGSSAETMGWSLQRAARIAALEARGDGIPAPASTRT